MIRRSLAHDFRYFSLAAFVLFGLTMAVMFRSVRVFLGMLATCSSAVLLTLLLQSFFGQKIGILTVNLGTIVFIIALSHLVYMTFNWQTLARRMGKESSGSRGAARRMTFPASFWSMVCASLGFGSLFIVAGQATARIGIWRRARDGRGIRLRICDVSVVSALGRAAQDANSWRKNLPRSFGRADSCLPSLATILLGIGLGFGLTRINTDPSLLDYFKPAPGTARRTGIRGPSRRREPAHPRRVRGQRQQAEHRRGLSENVDAARRPGK